MLTRNPSGSGVLVIPRMATVWPVVDTSRESPPASVPAGSTRGRGRTAGTTAGFAGWRDGSGSSKYARVSSYRSSSELDG
jgi:hypothetical protein